METIDEKNDLVKLFKTEYVIFLTYKFMKNKCYKYFKKSLLSYFNKYNVVYLNYDEKHNILQHLENYNTNLKMKSEKEKKDFCTRFNIKKAKLIYFLENVIEPNTLYKKISFSQEELFMSFDNYLIKKMEYKLRTFCQIAEKLGAEEIKIKYDTKQDNKSTINVNFSLPTSEIGMTSDSSHENSGKVDLMFKYSNYQHNLNLNKYYIIELIESENEFFISKEEFHSDIDLKFLIDARCLNLIQLYNTKIIINRTNQLERKIFMKAENYGLSLGSASTSNDFVSLNISIKFIDIYQKPECINGTNLYVYKQGFWHLVNIIKKQLNGENANNNTNNTNNNNTNTNNNNTNTNNNTNNNKSNENKPKRKFSVDITPSFNPDLSISCSSSDNFNNDNYNGNYDSNNNNDNKLDIGNNNREQLIYLYVHNFLETHLNSLQKRQFTIDTIYNKNQNLLNTYNDIIKLHFPSPENLNTLFRKVFENNLIYSQFETLRDIIIGGNPNLKNQIFRENDEMIKGLYFTVIQYHKILSCNETVINNIQKYTEVICKDILNCISLSGDEEFMKMINQSLASMEMFKIINDNKNLIINTITNALKYSYMVNYPIKLKNYGTIYYDALNIMNNEFDIKFSDVLNDLNKMITEYNIFVNIMNDNDSQKDINIDEKKPEEKKPEEKKISGKLKNELLTKIRAISGNGNNQNNNGHNNHNNNNQNDKISSPVKIHQRKPHYTNNNNIKASKILHYVINKVLEEVSAEIEIFYESNHPGFVLNIIANLLVKYFCFKYDRGNILGTEFFKNPSYYKTLDDIAIKIKPIISEHQCKSNYQHFKIYYTWENFKTIINEFESKFISSDVRTSFIRNSKTNLNDMNNDINNQTTTNNNINSLNKNNFPKRRRRSASPPVIRHNIVKNDKSYSDPEDNGDIKIFGETNKLNVQNKLMMNTVASWQSLVPRKKIIESNKNNNQNNQTNTEISLV